LLIAIWLHDAFTEIVEIPERDFHGFRNRVIRGRNEKVSFDRVSPDDSDRNAVSEQYSISSEFGADIGSARQGEMSRREQLQRPERLENRHQSRAWSKHLLCKGFVFTTSVKECKNWGRKPE
jgi:hypothetical protein